MRSLTLKDADNDAIEFEDAYEGRLVITTKANDADGTPRVLLVALTTEQATMAHEWLRVFLGKPTEVKVGFQGQY